jgi:hypothetical protein
MDLVVLETAREDFCFQQMLNDSSELIFLRAHQLIKSFGCLKDMSTRQVWLGMDSINKSSFAWINSAAMVVDNWATGMPTSAKKEACVAIKHEISIFLVCVIN